MKISLILTTQGNRLEDVNRFIKSLDNSEYREFELIFIDQSDDNSMLEIIKMSKSLDKIRYIKVAKISLSRARNLGLEEVQGEIVCFPDDDCWYPESLLNDVKNYFICNGSIDVLCSNVYDPDTNLYYGKRREKIKGTVHIKQSNAFKYPISVGLFIRRAKEYPIYLDEELGAGSKWGSGEETDLILRMLKNGHHIKFVSELCVYHPVGTELNWSMSKFYSYGIGFGATIRKAIKRKQYFVIFELLEICIRSCGGVILYFLKDPIKSRSYFARLRGIVKGLIAR